MRVGRWVVNVGRSNARHFRIVGLEVWRLTAGWSIHFGIGQVLIFYLVWWRE